MNQTQAFMVMSVMVLAGCSSGPSANNDALASGHQHPTIYHEQQTESGLFGNTIQFWLLERGLTENHKSEVAEQGIHQQIDRVLDHTKDQRQSHSTIQKSGRQLAPPHRQQPARRFKSSGNRPINR